MCWKDGYFARSLKSPWSALGPDRWSTRLQLNSLKKIARKSTCLSSFSKCPRMFRIFCPQHSVWQLNFETVCLEFHQENLLQLCVLTLRSKKNSKLLQANIFVTVLKLEVWNNILNFFYMMLILWALYQKQKIPNAEKHFDVVYKIVWNRIYVLNWS